MPPHTPQRLAPRRAPGLRCAPSRLHGAGYIGMPEPSLQSQGSQTIKPPLKTSSMVRARGFEPPTPCSRSRCATRLRHARTGSQIKPEVTRTHFINSGKCKRVYLGCSARRVATQRVVPFASVATTRCAQIDRSRRGCPLYSGSKMAGTPDPGGKCILLIFMK